LLRKARGLPKDERLNLFENVQVEYQKTDKEIDQKKWEDKHTWYLGKQGDAKPWYASLSKREPDSTDSKVQRRKRVEEKRMRLEDPLTAIQKAKVTKHRHDPERGPRTRERLEREALEREASERNRLLELLGENRHQDQRQYYNSQFNPNLVKKH
jgi:hypothetical protein